MASNRNQAKALADAWGILMRYRWRFIIPAFLVFTAMIVGSLLLPRKYNAEAIFERRTDMVLWEIITRGAPSSFLDPRQSLTEEIVGSPALDRMGKTLEARKNEDGSPTFDRADVARLRDEMEHKVIVKYPVFNKMVDRVRVIFVGTDSELARAGVNTLVSNYIDKQERELKKRLGDSAKFFEAEVASSRRAIEKLEKIKLEFEIENAELLPDNPNNIQTIIGEAEADLAELKQQRDALKMQVKSLTRSIERTPVRSHSIVMGPNPDLVQVRSHLKELRGRLVTYVDVNKMTEKHPDLIDLRTQITMTQQTAATLDEEIITSTEYFDNPKRSELQVLRTKAISDLSAISKNYTAQQEQLVNRRAQAANLFPVRADYSKITRQVNQAQQQLAFWADNLRLLGMSMAAESGNRGIRLDFIKPCPALWRPVSPDLTQVLMGAMLLGLLAGALSVLFAHRTDETFRGSEELIGSFDLPLLGTVSEIISRQHRRLRRLRKIVVYPINAVVMAGVLIVVTAVLYFNLKEPRLYEAFKDDPVTFLKVQLQSAKTAVTSVKED